MKHRLGCAGLFFGFFVALAAACGGASDSDVTTDTPDGGSSSGSSGSSSGTSGSSSGSSGSSSGSSGSSGATDASADASADADADAAPADTVFTGAPAYTPTTGRSTKKPGDHPNGGNPSKLACLSCHGPAGPGPEWFAGGSVFKDVAATMPAAQIEVRLRDGAGKAVSTYTDVLGNFLITKQTAATAGLTFPLHSGARDATSTSLMTDITPNGDCNSGACHGGAQGFIHVP